MSPSRGHVVLGVSGGVAAYKAAEVLRGFQAAGFDVHVTMTENAGRFVGSLTFAALSGHPVSEGRLGGASDGEMAHVELTRDAALFVVAPATANVIGKLAGGLADDWLTTHYVASEAPVVLAPAMNQRMWRHPAVIENVSLLRSRGALVVEPDEGELACGEVGPGRLAAPEAIVAAGLEILRGAGAWVGRRVLVTSGPTQEDVDPVRYIGNRSSGKMGQALAAEAARAGAEVVLVTGPTALAPPPGCRVVRVRSAREMAAAVRREAPGRDALFFAAAVADFRPVERSEEKIRRGDREHLELQLVRNPDALAEGIAAAPDALVVGFAAEVGADLERVGREKLARKGCDMIVANRVDGPLSAFGADDNELLVVANAREPRRLERASKASLARRLLEEAADLLDSGGFRERRSTAGASTAAPTASPTDERRDP